MAAACIGGRTFHRTIHAPHRLFEGRLRCSGSCPLQPAEIVQVHIVSDRQSIIGERDGIVKFDQRHLAMGDHTKIDCITVGRFATGFQFFDGLREQLNTGSKVWNIAFQTC